MNFVTCWTFHSWRCQLAEFLVAGSVLSQLSNNIIDTSSNGLSLENVWPAGHFNISPVLLSWNIRSYHVANINLGPDLKPVIPLPPTCEVVITACEDSCPPWLRRDWQLSCPGQLLLKHFQIFSFMCFAFFSPCNSHWRSRKCWRGRPEGGRSCLWRPPGTGN